MSKIPIESTNHIQTISQRESAARRHISCTLSQLRKNLLILGELKAAEHCRAAMSAIGGGG